MNALWIGVLLAFHTVRVPSVTLKGAPYVSPASLAQAFGWKQIAPKTYRTPEGSLLFDPHEVRFQNTPMEVRTTVYRNTRFYQAEDLEPLLDRVTGKHTYWDRERSRYILSAYPPSVKRLDLKADSGRVHIQIQHNSDLRPKIISVAPKTVRIEIPRGFYKGTHRFHSQGLLAGAEMFHTARGFQLFLSFERPVTFEVQRRKTTFLVTFRPTLPSVLQKPEEPPSPQIESTRREPLVIVIDPGHGGKDPGAIGRYGTREKDINLAVAKRLKRILEKDLHARVILTRDRDRFVPLRDRTEIANRTGADLFISLHCNYERRHRIQGAETYFLSAARTRWERAVQNLENGALKYELGPEMDTTNLLKLILSDMAQAQFLKESQSLAVSIQDHLASALKLKNRGVKQAGFYVLLGAYMPSVLVEMGFISHPSEEKRLRQKWYQEKIAKGIAKGIRSFLKHRDQAWVPAVGG